MYIIIYNVLHADYRLVIKNNIRGDLMKVQNPIGIKLIAWFQIFGALIVLFTLNIQQSPPFNVRFAMPFIPETIIKILLVISTLIISYGYLRQTKYGYWSMIIYSVLFCCISFFQSINYGIQPFIGNTIYSGFVTIYTILHREYFTKNNCLFNIFN